MPFVYFYNKQIDYYNKTVHDILAKEIPLILPNFQKRRKERRGIITLLATAFIGLAYKGISSYLHNKIQTHLKESLFSYGKPSKLRKKQIFIWNTLW